MATSESSRNIGRVIQGRYRIVELLGRGGMAEVYKAYQESLDRYVAIKLMHGFLADDEEFLRRFQREARSVATLRHPNIVQVHDFDRDEDDYFMVMEYIDGPTLKSVLEELAGKQARFPHARALNIVRDLGRALSYAHKRGMVHRDIKPANIMVDSGDHVVLTDFGIAKMVTGTQLTASGSMIGTPSYMAPEQGLGKAGDQRSDLYSLGVVLYQLLTGHLPYQADTPLAVILMHVNDPLPDPVTINPDLSPGLQRIIQRSLAKVPTERYQTVDEMLQHLENLDLAALQEVPHSTLVGGNAETIRAAMDQSSETEVSPGQAAEATAVPMGATPAPLPVEDTLSARRNRSLIWGIGGGVVVIVLLGILGILGLRGGFLGLGVDPTATATETATLAPSATATASAVPTATQDVFLTLTIQSIERTTTALAAIPTNTHTPDLTATFEACDFDYSLLAQEPEDDTDLFVNQVETVTLKIGNSGDCSWEAENTVLQFVEGAAPPEAEQQEVALPEVAPGDSVEVEILLDTPSTAGTAVATWKLITTDTGVAVGALLEFIFNVVDPVIVVPTFTPTPTATAVPSGPTNTPTGPITGVSATFFRCDYDETDYTCDVVINIGGGAPPFTVLVGADTISCNPNTGSTCNLEFRQRRCNAASFAIDVVDSQGARFSGIGGIDPQDPAYKIFPPDHKSFCSG